MKPKRPMIDVSARMFYAALTCVSTEETRYYLNGVHIERHPEKGAVLVATDGHRMLVLHDEAGHCEKSAIIPAGKDLIAALARGTKDGDGRLFVDKVGIVSLPGGSYLAAENSLINGTFPQWPRVVQPVLAALRQKKIGYSAFNPRLLGSFSAVAKRLSIGGDYPSIKVVTVEEAFASLILFSGSRAVFGLLMPMRSDIDPGVPIFMKPIMSALPKLKKTPPVKAAAKPKPKPKPAPKRKRAA